MRRWLLLGLLGWWLACTSVYAQPLGATHGPQFLDPQVWRLPPVDPHPGPAAEVPAAAANDAVAEPLLENLPTEEVVIETEPQRPSKPWEGSFELGLDGSEGNSQTFNFRLGFDAERTTRHNVFALDLDYRKTSNALVETANRAFLDWRYERLFEDSRWTSFVHGTVDYDEFQAFDLRASLDVGLGYHLIKTEAMSLAARFGSGCSREIGGPDDAYVPEAVLGLDFEHRLNKRHKFTASAEYSPDVTGLNDFRLKSRASWEALVDKKMNLSLKLSILERYDSTPHGAEPNDLDYAAVLLWKF